MRLKNTALASVSAVIVFLIINWLVSEFELGSVNEALISIAPYCLIAGFACGLIGALKVSTGKKSYSLEDLTDLAEEDYGTGAIIGMLTNAALLIIIYY